MTIKLRLSEEDITKGILDGVLYHVNNFINSNQSFIIGGIRQRVFDKLTSSDEWLAIDGGELEDLLEINSASLALAQIASAISKSAEIVVKPFKKSGLKINGGIQINILKTDYSDILGIVPPEVIHGVEKDWLRWLLEDGDDVNIFNFDVDWEAESTTIGEAIDDISRYYHVNPKPNNLLRDNPTGERGVLGIPAQYQGTKGNNFITRALAGIEKDIQEFFSRIR